MTSVPLILNLYGSVYLCLFPPLLSSLQPPSGLSLRGHKNTSQCFLSSPLSYKSVSVCEMGCCFSLSLSLAGLALCNENSFAYYNCVQAGHGKSIVSMVRKKTKSLIFVSQLCLSFSLQYFGMPVLSVHPPPLLSLSVSLICPEAMSDLKGRG